MTLAETERTRIESITRDDAAFFVQLVNSKDWLKYIGDRGVHSEDDARSYLENGFLKCQQEHGFGYYLVRLKVSRDPIGICGFLKKPNLENPDFGFALLPDYYGQGLAQEFSAVVLELGIRTFGFQTLDAVTTPDNTRSQRLLEKLKFELQGAASPDGDLLLYRLDCATAAD